MWRTIVVACMTVALSLAAVADAKDFKPGDIRVCAATTCRPLVDRRALGVLGAFYYSEKAAPRAVRGPAARAPFVELRFRNGYVTGIAAGSRFDRFLSYGVNLGQFRARVWYAVPARVAAAIRSLAATLHPRPLPADVLENSH